MVRRRAAEFVLLLAFSVTQASPLACEWRCATPGKQPPAASAAASDCHSEPDGGAGVSVSAAHACLSHAVTPALAAAQPPQTRQDATLLQSDVSAAVETSDVLAGAGVRFALHDLAPPGASPRVLLSLRI